MSSNRRAIFYNQSSDSKKIIDWIMIIYWARIQLKVRSIISIPNQGYIVQWQYF
jgi:hypothetical protein